MTELEWSLLGLWLIQLFAVREQLSVDAPPERSSVAIALSVIRRAMQAWNQPTGSEDALSSRLQTAVLDRYRRHTCKRGRYRPPIKDIPCTHAPIVRRATPKQRRAYLTAKLAATNR